MGVLGLRTYGYPRSTTAPSGQEDRSSTAVSAVMGPPCCVAQVITTGNRVPARCTAGVAARLPAGKVWHDYQLQDGWRVLVRYVDQDRWLFLPTVLLVLWPGEGVVPLMAGARLIIGSFRPAHR